MGEAAAAQPLAAARPLRAASTAATDATPARAAAAAGAPVAGERRVLFCFVVSFVWGICFWFGGLERKRT